MKASTHSFDHPPELIRLIGSREENFYQLGLKDSGRHNLLLSQIENLISLPGLQSQATRQVFKEAAKAYFSHRFRSLDTLREKIQPYLEGLNAELDPKKKIQIEDYLFAMLIPELSSCLSHWVPGLPPTLFGCSSFFTLDSQTGRLLHGRILDFPLQGAFDAGERVLHTQWQREKKGFEVVSFGSAGFPFPSITAMTSSGVSLAIHQKFTDVLNPEGRPIFDLVDDFLQTVTDPESALSFLENAQSLTTWGLYIGFDLPDQKPSVLEVEIRGKEFVSTHHELREGDVLHFHNTLLKNPEEQDLYLPFGISAYNEMREYNANKKCQRLQKRKRRQAGQFLKEITTLEKNTSTNSRSWKMDSITPSTMTAVVMTPAEGSFVANHGRAPKIANGHTYEGKKFWKSGTTPKIQLKKTRNAQTVKNLRAQGLRDLMQAQVCSDGGKVHELYHYMQMGLHHLREAESHGERIYGEFFFQVFQYMHETHKKRRIKNLENFRRLVPELPPYLQDHGRLFVTRLERILKLPQSYGEDDIQHAQLREVFRSEQSIPDLLLYHATAKAMAPRIDLADIIYLHVLPKKEKTSADGRRGLHILQSFLDGL